MIQQKSSLSNLLKATIPYNPLNISPTVQTHLLDRACPMDIVHYPCEKQSIDCQQKNSKKRTRTEKLPSAQI